MEINHFSILIYDSNYRTARNLKDKLVDWGFQEVMTEADRENIISAALKYNPNVVITDHRPEDGLDAASLVKELRKIFDLPIVIWGDRPDEDTENFLLSFGKTYTLRSKDGMVSLTDILWRLDMKSRHPQLWA